MLQALLISHNLGDVFCLPFFSGKIVAVVTHIRYTRFKFSPTCIYSPVIQFHCSCQNNKCIVTYLSYICQTPHNSSQIPAFKTSSDVLKATWLVAAFLHFSDLVGYCNFWRHPTQRKGTIGFSAKVHDSLKFNFDKYTIRRHWNIFSDFEVRCAFAFLSATAMWVAIGQPASEVPKPLFCSTKNVFWQLFNPQFHICSLKMVPFSSLVGSSVKHHTINET